jgi:hypothetical protein
MMDFRQVLTRLDEYRAKGIGYVDSGYLSAVMGGSRAQASKRLSRLHGMGFLVRDKHRRRCFSKRGKSCYKGYYYEYSFSRQGRKYVEWLKNSRLAQKTLYGLMISNAATLLPEREKDTLSSFALYRSKMRYSGPSRDVQEFGFLASHALPGLTRKLEETSAQRDKMEFKRDLLEFKCDQLQGVINDQASKINHLEEKGEELLAKAERDAKRKDQEFQKTAGHLIDKFIEMSQALDSAIDAIRGVSSLSAAQEGIIRELELALGSKNPEKTVEFLKLVARGQSPEMSRARDYVKRAQKTLQEVQERIRPDQLKVAPAKTA